MRKVTRVLNSEECAALRELLEASDDPDVCVRARALLLLAEDMGYRGAARAVAVNESAVRKWHAAFRAEGVAGLRTRDRSGRPPKLTQADRARLDQALGQAPETVGAEGEVWTARALNQYLQSLSATRVSDWTVWAYMRERGAASVDGLPSEVQAKTQEEQAMPNQSSGWDPMQDLLTLRQAMDRLFDEARSSRGSSLPASGGSMLLPVDVYSTENEVVVVASMPGMNSENVEIICRGDAVTIKGEIQPPQGNVQWAVQERPYGTFSRTLTLNVPVDTSQADATFENGVLRLTLPKAESAKPRMIQIKRKELSSGEGQ